MSTPTTSFYYDTPKQIKEILAQRPKEDALKYYQRIFHDWMLKNNQRGILLDFGLGTGKSIAMVSLIHSLSQKYPDRKVLFISEKSLHANIIKNLEKYLELINEKDNIKKALSKYNFISLNASNMFDQVMRTQQASERISEQDLHKIGIDIEENPDLENINDTILCVDEAHLFFNSIANGSKNALSLYDRIMAAKNINIIFSTGSPIVNSPYESAICFNMIRGLINDNTLFPEDYTLFMRLFCDMGTDAEDPDKLTINSDKTVKMPSIKNRSKFQDRVTGLTSYYGLDTAEGKDAEDLKSHFPTQNPIMQVKVPMSSYQWSAYAAARDKELIESRRAQIRQAQSRNIHKPKGTNSSYRVRSRQVGNFRYPDEALTSNNTKGYIEIVKHPEKIPQHCFEVDWNNKSGLEDLMPIIDKKGGKDKDTEIKIKDKEIKTSLLDHSPKLFLSMCYAAQHLPWIKGLDHFRKFAKNLPQPEGPIVNGPGVIYSEFVENLIYPASKALEAIGFQPWDLATDKVRNVKDQKPTYAILSGEVDAETRNIIIDSFNNPDNIDGHRIAILLITKTGAQGIDTKGGTWIMAIEPHWTAVRLLQLWKRVVRLYSHDHLPKNRRFVQPYLFLATYPRSTQKNNELITMEETTDIYIYINSLRNHYLNNEFLIAQREVSLDCMAHHPSGKFLHCRQCAPTNQPLYTKDLLKDLAASDHCKPLQVSHIKVKMIKIDEEQYAYKVENGKLHIFIFRETLGAYQEVPSGTPLYSRVANIINAAK